MAAEQKAMTPEEARTAREAMFKHVSRNAKTFFPKEEKDGGVKAAADTSWFVQEIKNCQIDLDFQRGITSRYVTTADDTDLSMSVYLRDAREQKARNPEEQENEWQNWAIMGLSYANTVSKLAGPKVGETAFDLKLRGATEAFLQTIKNSENEKDAREDLAQFSDALAEALATYLELKPTLLEHLKSPLTSTKALNLAKARKMIEQCKDFTNFDQKPYATATLVQHDGKDILEMDAPIFALTDDLKKQYEDLENQSWYKQQPKHIRKLIKYYLPDILEGRVIPAQLINRLPGMRNAGETRIFDVTKVFDAKKPGAPVQIHQNYHAGNFGHRIFSGSGTQVKILAGVMLVLAILTVALVEIYAVQLFGFVVEKMGEALTGTLGTVVGWFSALVVIPALVLIPSYFGWRSLYRRVTIKQEDQEFTRLAIEQAKQNMPADSTLIVLSLVNDFVWAPDDDSDLKLKVDKAIHDSNLPDRLARLLRWVEQKLEEQHPGVQAFVNRDPVPAVADIARFAGQAKGDANLLELLEKTIQLKQLMRVPLAVANNRGNLAWAGSQVNSLFNQYVNDAKLQVAPEVFNADGHAHLPANLGRLVQGTNTAGIEQLLRLVEQKLPADAKAALQLGSHDVTTMPTDNMLASYVRGAVDEPKRTQLRRLLQATIQLKRLINLPRLGSLEFGDNRNAQLASKAAQVASLLNEYAEKPVVKVFFVCKSGKDRTGVVSVMAAADAVHHHCTGKSEILTKNNTSPELVRAAEKLADAGHVRTRAGGPCGSLGAEGVKGCGEPVIPAVLKQSVALHLIKKTAEQNKHMPKQRWRWPQAIFRALLAFVTYPLFLVYALYEARTLEENQGKWKSIGTTLVSLAVSVGLVLHYFLADNPVLGLIELCGGALAGLFVPKILRGTLARTDEEHSQGNVAKGGLSRWECVLLALFPLDSMRTAVVHSYAVSPYDSYFAADKAAEGGGNNGGTYSKALPKDGDAAPKPVANVSASGAKAESSLGSRFCACLMGRRGGAHQEQAPLLATSGPSAAVTPTPALTAVVDDGANV